MPEKSLKKNFIYNLILSISNIVIPMLTFPYITRVLSPAGMGKVNYVGSIMGYLTLISCLGVNSYAVKEGSRYRNSKACLGKFVRQILAINLTAVIISYSIFFILLRFPSLRDYRLLFVIYGVNIIASPLSLQWFFTLVEEYGFITKRTILIQAVSAACVFLFVRQPGDYIKYAVIVVLTSVISMIVNIMYVRHFIDRLGIDISGIKTYLVPVLLVFGSSVSATLYLNSDITILGYLIGDYDVGIYSGAVKLCRMVITVGTSLTNVLLPRVSYYFGIGEKEKYYVLLNKGFSYLLMIVIPSAVGLAVTAEGIVRVFLGNQYGEAIRTIQFLAADIILSPVSGFISYQIILPHNKERIFLVSTMISCLFNITFNVIFIPEYGQYAAVISTLMSEVINIMICYFASRKDISYKTMCESIKDFVFASFMMMPVILVLNHVIEIFLLRLLVSVPIGILVYLGFLSAVRNSIWTELKSNINMQIKKTCADRRRNI